MLGWCVCVCQWQRLILGEEKCKGVALTFISHSSLYMQSNAMYSSTKPVFPTITTPQYKPKPETGNSFFFYSFIYLFILGLNIFLKKVLIFNLAKKTT